MNIFLKLEEMSVEFKLKLTDKTHPENMALFLGVVLAVLFLMFQVIPVWVLWILIFVGAVFAIKLLAKAVRLISYALQVRKTNKYNEKTWKRDSRISEPPYSR